MNNNIVKKVSDFLDEYGLTASQSPFLVAFSGGYDSMCLLHILKKLKIPNKIIAMHLNHNWRGEESLQEEINCKNFCKTLGIDFYAETLSDNIPQTETAARDARYLFFENCAKKFNTNIVFTAHNANDNAETLIYRIAKGTAIDGLAGIAEVREIYYRPLLKVPRTEIETYCLDYNLFPNNDSSNSNTKYNRNFIRHKILPKLEKINPDAIMAINSLSELAKEDSDYLDKIAQSIGTSTDKFSHAEAPIQKRVIKNLLIKNNIDYDRSKIELLLEFIQENINSKAGKVISLSDNLLLFVNTGTIKIITKPEAKIENIIEIKEQGFYEFGDFVFSIMPCNTIPEEFPEDFNNYAYIQAEKINFKLRTRRDGDTFAPIGLNGKHQKLKKYLNEKKVPQHKKDSLVFLCNDEEILWVPGLGLSDKIKVTTHVTHIIKLNKKRETNEKR